MKSSEFVFDCLQLLYNICYEINLNCSSYYEIIENYYSLIYEKNKEHPKRRTEMKPFISNYNWEGINYQPEKYDWKKVEKNNLTIALNEFV